MAEIDLTQQRGPAEVITLEQYREALRAERVLDPSTLVLVPVTDIDMDEDDFGIVDADQSMVDAGSPLVYQHLLYFESESQSADAKEHLVTRRPRVVCYQSIEVQDVAGDAVLILTTAEQLSHAERAYITRTVRPAFEKFNLNDQRRKDNAC